MSGRSPPVSVREIELQLRARCETVVRDCLPNAVRDGHWLRIGSIGGEKGQSLAVTLAGASRGLWTDFSASAGSAEAGGDMLGMIALTKFSGDLGQAVAWAKSWLGLDDLDPARLATMRAETAARDRGAEAAALNEAQVKRDRARGLWLSAAPLNGACPASRYLAGRGIAVDLLGKWPGALRYHPEVYNVDARHKLPALVSQMILPNGEHVATHRTWLGRDRHGAWVKAEDADTGVPRGGSKKMIGKSGGAFVPLRKGASRRSMGQMLRPEAIYITEGIEDALTVAMARPALRVVAGYSLGNLGRISFPATIETIVIVADRDEDARAIDALEAAIARQQARGHRVRIVLPARGVKDINAWLNASAERAA